MDENRTLSLRMDNAATKERLLEKLEGIAEMKSRSLGFMVTEAIREYVQRAEGGPDTVQMHKTQQQQTGMLESAVSMLGTLTTTLRDAMIEHGVFKKLATKRIDGHKKRIEFLEHVAGDTDAAIFNLRKQNEILAVTLFPLLKAANPDWTSEEANALRDKLIKQDRPLPGSSILSPQAFELRNRGDDLTASAATE